MALTISDGGGVLPVADTRPAPVATTPAATPQADPAVPADWRPTPSEGQEPQVSLPEHQLPPGTTLGEVASGTQAQPFDVTLSQLATAVYDSRGAPPAGWTSVSDQQLTELGVQDPQAWRLQYLGFNASVSENAQEFRADIYTDGNGNYVLSYRGTAEGAADWDNNFTQGTGFETPDGDKFSVTAANTAVEFARVFGNGEGGAAPDNLAITGHSQGGGLATVGSLASGVPAVTFDASGIHPNTWDRMGIDPQAARDVAEGGQIRAYSLEDDALTKVQDTWVTGIVAPDALGTQIVVAPAAADTNDMFSNYGPIEGFDQGTADLINTGVELARNPETGVPIGGLLGGGGGYLVGSLFGGPAGGLVGGGIGLVAGPVLTTAVGDIAYSAISHNPNALTAGMVENQPWQPGYENPSSLGRDLQNLLPDELKDDFARNTHDLITDVQEVIDTDFANGDVVQGGFSIAGDVAEGAFNSAGDTVDRYADQWAADIDANVGGLAGDVLSTVVDGGGSVIEFGTDVAGQATEFIADGAGALAQGATDFIGGLFK